MNANLKQELKALGQLTWFLAKMIAAIILTQQLIWAAWVVMG
jgi:hypothetical protein